MRLSARRVKASSVHYLPAVGDAVSAHASMLAHTELHTARNELCCFLCLPAVEYLIYCDDAVRA